MKLLFLFFIFEFMQHVSICWCNHIKADKKMYLVKPDYEKDFIPTSPTNVERKDHKRNKNLGSEEVMLRNFIPDSYLKLLKIISKEIQRNKTAAERKSNGCIINNIDTMNKRLVELSVKCKTHIAKEGHCKLRKVGKIIVSNLKPTFNISDMLLNVTMSYEDELHSYFQFIQSQELNSAIDWDFYFLDIIESSNRLLLSESKILYHNILASMNRSALDTNENFISEEIQKVVNIEKKHNLNYICKIADVCKIFPTYSDRIALLLGEIIKLPNSNFQAFVTLLTEVVGIKYTFYKTLMNDDIQYIIMSKLKKVSKYLPDMYNLFLVLQGVITHRNIMFSNNHREINIRTKAIRILIDMIDKTFDQVGDGLLRIEFDNLMNTFKDWAIDETINMEPVFTNFWNQLFDVIKYYWDIETQEEVKVLIEVIMTGTSENNIIHDNLFTKGPKLLRDELISIY